MSQDTPERLVELRDIVDDKHKHKDEILFQRRLNKTLRNFINHNNRRIKTLECKDPLYVLKTSTTRMEFLEYLTSPGCPDEYRSLDGCLTICMERDVADAVPQNAAPHIFETLIEAAIFLGVGRFGQENGIMNETRKRGYTVYDPKSFTPMNVKEYWERTSVKASQGSKADVLIKVGVTPSDEYKSEWVCNLPPDALSDYERHLTESKTSRKSIWKAQSVKQFVHEKSAEKYDIEQLVGEITERKEYNPTKEFFEIHVCVKDRPTVEETLRRSRRELLRKSYGFVHGLDELNRDFPALMAAVRLYLSKSRTISHKFMKEPMLHQRAIVKKTIQAIDETIRNGTDATFLWGAVARSGKTLTSAFLVDKLRENNPGKYNRIIVLTPFPTETMSQWIDEYTPFIEKWGGRKEWKIMCSNSTLCNGTDKVNIENLEHSNWIYVLSLQSAKINPVTLEGINKNKPDVIFFDEAHYGGEYGENKRTIAIVDAIFKRRTRTTNQVLVYLTATYGKILQLGNRTPVQKQSWSLDDNITLKQMQSLGDIDLLARRNEVVELLGLLDEEVPLDLVELRNSLRPYSRIPDMHVIGGYFISGGENIESIGEKLGDYKRDGGWDINGIFHMVDDRFTHIEWVEWILQRLMGSGRPDEYSIYGQIENIQESYGKLVDFTGRNVGLKEPISQLWFMPSGVGLKIEPLILAVFRLIRTSHKLRRLLDNYTFVSLNHTDETIKRIHALMPIDKDGDRQFYGVGGDVKKSIKEREHQAYVLKKGVIFLTSKRVTTGITLPCVDVIGLFDNVQSVDMGFQKIYRAMTDRNEKPCAVIFDVNPKRTLSAIQTNVFSGLKEGKTRGKNIKRYLTDIVLLEEGLLGFEKLELPEILGVKRQISEAAFSMLGDTRDGGMLKVLEEDFSTNAAIEEVASRIRIGKSNVKQNMKRKDGSAVKNADRRVVGAQLAAAGAGGDEAAAAAEERRREEEGELVSEPEQNVKRKLLYGVLNRALMYAIADWAISRDGSTLCGASEAHKETFREALVRLNTVLREMLMINYKEVANIELDEDGQNILWDGLVSVAEKNQEKIEFIASEAMPSIHETDKLIEQYEKNLAPREDEKNNHGEVFTPRSLVLDMLNHVPNSFWTRHDVVVLDPAAGFGQQSAVAFELFMKGLEKWQPNKDKRCKHILENILQQVEINSSSVNILKRIFGKDANISKQSQFDALPKEWPSKFDMIMGNPPYNVGGVAKGGGVVWAKFVKISLEKLNKDGFITFVHPLGWKKPTGERASAGDIWKEQREMNMIYLNMNTVKFTRFPRVDYQVVQNKSVHNDTEIKCKQLDGSVWEGKLNLYGLPFIPNVINDKIQHILNKVLRKKGGILLNFIRNQTFKPSTKDALTKGVPHAHYQIPDKDVYDIKYKFYSKTPEYIGKFKLVAHYKSAKKPQHLYAKYFSTPVGTTDNTMYMIVNSSNGRRIERELNSNLFTFLMMITQYSEAPNYINEFKILNMIHVPKSSTDLMIYYGLSRDESSYIENSVDNATVKRTTPRKKVKSMSSIKSRKSVKKRAQSAGGRRTMKHRRTRRRRC